MRRGHELGDERAAVRRARERIGPDAPPAGVVAGVVVAPELLVLEELLVEDVERCLCRGASSLHASTIDAMSDRDLALVLSGGGMNGLLLELGFLKRLREDPLWERIGWIYGTSAGALSGRDGRRSTGSTHMEEFVLALRPEETFRPNRLWQTPAERPARLRAARDDRRAARADRRARRRTSSTSPIELVVTRHGRHGGRPAGRAATRTSASTRAGRRRRDVMARAVLASAAISALVLPLRVGDVIGTDGGWVRNFPLGHAYDNPDVGEIVGFRYVSRHDARAAREPRAAPPPARAVPRGPARAGADRRAARRGGAAGARRAAATSPT